MQEAGPEKWSCKTENTPWWLWNIFRQKLEKSKLNYVYYFNSEYFRHSIRIKKETSDCRTETHKNNFQWVGRNDVHVYEKSETHSEELQNIENIRKIKLLISYLQSTVELLVCLHRGNSKNTKGLRTHCPYWNFPSAKSYQVW